MKIEYVKLIFYNFNIWYIIKGVYKLKLILILCLLLSQLCFSADLFNGSSFDSLINTIAIDKKENLGDPNMKVTLNQKNNISESLNERVNNVIENIKIGLGGEVQFLNDYKTYTSGIGAQYYIDKNNKILTSISYKYYDFENRFSKNGFERETRVEYNINNRYSVYTKYSFNQLDETAKSGQFAAGFNFIIKN